MDKNHKFKRGSLVVAVFGTLLYSVFRRPDNSAGGDYGGAKKTPHGWRKSWELPLPRVLKGG